MKDLANRLSRSLVSFFPSEGLFALRSIRDIPARLQKRPHEPDFVVFGPLDSDSAVFVDIGANRGQSIRSIRLFGPKAHIHAFEPGAQLAAHIDGLFGGENVTVHHCGLGAKPGPLALYLPKYGNTVYDTRAALTEDQAWSFLADENFVAFDRSRATVVSNEIRIETLDSFSLAPTAIKIDVEGADFDVVEGGWETISSHLPLLMIEFPSNETTDRLTSVGYESYALVDGRLTLSRDAELNTLFLQPAHVERLSTFVESNA